MRKFFFLTALVSVVPFIAGCAVTDVQPGFFGDWSVITPTTNSSHAQYDCYGQRIENAQQTLERYTHESMFEVVNASSGVPVATGGQPDRALARKINRFNGPYTGFQGASNGRDSWQHNSNHIVDGDLVMVGWRKTGGGFSGNQPAFGGCLGGEDIRMYAGNASESGFWGYTRLGASMRPGYIVIDEDPFSFGFGNNVYAVNDVVLAEGFTGFTAYDTGFGTIYNKNIPISRRGEAVLGRLMAGEVETIDILGYQVSARGELDAKDGIVLYPVRIEAPNGVVYEAGEEPIRIVVGSVDSRSIEMPAIEDIAAELVKLGTFAREAGMYGQTFEMPEEILGIPMHGLAFQLAGDGIDAWIERLSDGGSQDGGPGFGG